MHRQNATNFSRKRSILTWILLGAIAAVLSWTAIAVSDDQQLPGAGPIPAIRRGADGKIEVVPARERSPPAVTSPDVGARPATPWPGAAPADGASNPNAPPPALASTVGTRFALSADLLPAPNTTSPDDIDPIGVERPSGLLPRAPKGFSVSLFAMGAGNAR